MEPKQIRRLIWAFAFSGFLNIILVTSMIYGIIKERPPSLYCTQNALSSSYQLSAQTLEGASRTQILRLQTFSYNQLLAALDSSQYVENGYLERDFALACLVAYHHFDLERALSQPLDKMQKRTIIYAKQENGSPLTLIVFPALNDTHFAAVREFARLERWPKTSKGLYLALQKQKNSLDPSLLDAFFLTREFLLIDALFKPLEVNIERFEVARLLLEGDWATMAKAVQVQKKDGIISNSRRQNLLLEYLQKNSKTAASLLLKCDYLAALKQLEDLHVLKLLDLLEEKSELSEKYAMDLLKNPRSDAVWKAAASRLYDYAGEGRPERIHYQTTIARFLPSFSTKLQEIEKPQILTEQKTVPQQDHLYLVQKGDSLWKLSKRFNVDINLLRKHNQLANDVLKPGSPLRIPRE